MKRSTDEIRYLIFKMLITGKKMNLEEIRKRVNTGLPTIISNIRYLEKMGFVNLYQQNIGKRRYTEMQITVDGKRFFDRLSKLY